MEKLLSSIKSLHNFLPWWIKIPVAFIGFIIGSYMTVELWVIDKAKTVVESVKTEVRYLKQYNKDHAERVERELIMLRSTTDEIHKFLREKK